MNPDARSLRRNDAFAEALGARLIDDTDPLVVELIVGEEHLNFLGVVHGGVLFSLADIAMSLASNGNSPTAFAVDAHVSFVRGARPGDTLRARAEIESSSRTMDWYRVEVVDQDARTAALFKGMVYRPLTESS